MSCDWPLVKLDELANEITVGFVGSMTHEYVDKGVPFFRSKNISEYEIEWYDIRYISPAFHRRLKKSVLRPGDVAIVRTGKPGTACVIPDSVDEANCSDIVIVRVNNDKLSAHYLCYFMNSIASHQVSSHLVGAVQQHFNVASAKTIKIPLPKRDEQEEIVKILKALDDKRKINRQINQTLESIARAIFKSWFVDFEPVKAKIAAIEAGEDATRASMSAISGKTDQELDQLQAEQPEYYTQLKTIAELFPSSMEDSELGEIPKGWRIGDLGEFASISSGKRPKQKFDCKNKEFNVPLIGASSIMGYVNEILYKEPILVIGRVGTHGIIQRTFQPSYPSDNTLVIRSKYHEYVYQILNSIDYGSLNVGSTQPLITQTSIKHSKIVILDESLLDRFEKLSASMFSKINSNKTENQSLCDLRDFLLPKLLSGELSVSTSELAEGSSGI